MTNNTTTPPSTTTLAALAFARLVAGVVLLGAILFLTAGTIRYWEAWLYLALLLAFMTVFALYLLRRSPDLLQRRMRSKEPERSQVVIISVAGVALLLAIIIPGLDRRYGWSDVPVWLVIAANAVILLGYLLVIRVMRENHYASRVVEVERGQAVIDSGPYAVVRHPMYVAMLLIYGGTPLALGSYWGLLPVLVMPFILAARIVGEEKTLVRDLPGYEAYRQKVKYRLIPGLW
jgi:protein-S-isoprenylcysteine O-methyltransferase Ste14